MMIFTILLSSLFTTGITANSYCEQQLDLLQTATNNIKKNCFINKFTIKTCCDVDKLPQSIQKPPGIYQMQCRCGGSWSTTSVFCDTETADGGWIVIQRRKDGSVAFNNRPWSDYEKGFGDLNGEFWYGLKNMNCLTETGQWEMRVDFEFENGTKSYLHYNVFKVGSATDEYPLTISGFTGITAEDPFDSHNGMKFTTYDNDNDGYPNGNCATGITAIVGGTFYRDSGAWWYNNCWHINLNYQYNPPNFGFMQLAGTWYSPRWIEMKIRPLKCSLQ